MQILPANILAVLQIISGYWSQCIWNIVRRGGRCPLFPIKTRDCGFIRDWWMKRLLKSCIRSWKN